MLNFSAHFRPVQLPKTAKTVKKTVQNSPKTPLLTKAHSSRPAAKTQPMSKPVMPPTTMDMDSPLAGKQSVLQERSPLRYQELLSPEKSEIPY
ncbi:MAG: hypothetical protein LUC06_00365 [Oscillospiraceae bacterium]|nr:hypothetical protein [Oscillospiraceae bacterium]